MTRTPTTRSGRLRLRARHTLTCLRECWAYLIFAPLAVLASLIHWID